MRNVLTLISVIALAGCDMPESDAPREDKVLAGGGVDSVAEVRALPEARRKAVFFRAIRDAGLPCQAVTETEIVDETGKGPSWRARCEDGSAHLVRVMPDGTLYVTSRIPQG